MKSMAVRGSIVPRYERLSHSNLHTTLWPSSWRPFDSSYFYPESGVRTRPRWKDSSDLILFGGSRPTVSLPINEFKRSEPALCFVRNSQIHITILFCRRACCLTHYIHVKSLSSFVNQLIVPNDQINLTEHLKFTLRFQLVSDTSCISLNLNPRLEAWETWSSRFIHFPMGFTAKFTKTPIRRQFSHE